MLLPKEWILSKLSLWLERLCQRRPADAATAESADATDTAADAAKLLANRWGSLEPSRSLRERRSIVGSVVLSSNTWNLGATIACSNTTGWGRSGWGRERVPWGVCVNHLGVKIRRRC